MPAKTQPAPRREITLADLDTVVGEHDHTHHRSPWTEKVGGQQRQRPHVLVGSATNTGTCPWRTRRLLEYGGDGALLLAEA